MRDMKQRYLDGETCQQIANGMGCSVSTVWLRLQKMGVMMRSRGKVVDLDTREVVRLYTEGLSCAEIAALLHCDSKVIWRRLKDQGVVLRPAGGQVYATPEHLILEHYEKGVSQREVARATGVGRSVVSRCLVQNGVTVRGAVLAQRLPLDTTSIREKYAAGAPLKTIANQLGCSTTPIKGRLQEAGVILRAYTPAPKPLDINEEKLIDLYVNHGLPTTKMAHLLGCSYGTVLRRLHHAGVLVRESNFYTKLDLDTDTLTDMYTEGWSVQRLALHFGCSAHAILRRLKAVGVVLRSGSPHGGFHRYGNVSVKIDSGWEAHVYDLLHDAFGEEVLFQGEYGARATHQTPSICLTKPAHVRELFLPHKSEYRWTPDFYVPSLDLFIETKGWHARQKWNEVVVPTILGNTPRLNVGEIVVSPYRHKTWDSLSRIVRPVTSLAP